MPNNLSHIAFIMDGNGRWAKRRGKPRTQGHRAGLKTVENVVQWCVDNSIGYLSLYVFSTENWSRPQSEIDELFRLADRYLSNIEEMCAKGYRVVVSGSRDRLSDKLIKSIDNIERKTLGYSKLTINLCINYGGRQEIADICSHIASCGQSITQQSIDGILFANMPAPDIVVRTGGCMRLSNFMLYQCAYAELFFVDTLWPDVSAIELDSILSQYQLRTRNYGGLPNG